MDEDGGWEVQTGHTDSWVETADGQKTEDRQIVDSRQ